MRRRLSGQPVSRPRHGTAATRQAPAGCSPIAGRHPHTRDPEDSDPSWSGALRWPHGTSACVRQRHGWWPEKWRSNRSDRGDTRTRSANAPPRRCDVAHDASLRPSLARRWWPVSPRASAPATSSARRRAALTSPAPWPTGPRCAADRSRRPFDEPGGPPIAARHPRNGGRIGSAWRASRETDSIDRTEASTASSGHPPPPAPAGPPCPQKQGLSWRHRQSHAGRPWPRRIRYRCVSRRA